MYYLLAFSGSVSPIIYLVSPRTLGRSPSSYEPWARSDFTATAFASCADALAARDALLDARAYEAPECNNNLERRLRAAIIFEVHPNDVGQAVWRDGVKVHISLDPR